MNDKLLKYYIETWGCQMNEEDSEKLSGMLKRIGYTRTENKEEAGIILFNTCCVRENAENKVFGNLGALKKLKKKKYFVQVRAYKVVNKKIYMGAWSNVKYTKVRK